MKELKTPNGIKIETAKEFAERFPKGIRNEAAQMKHGLYVFDGTVWRPFDSRSDDLVSLGAENIVLIEHRDYFTGAKAS